MRKSNLVIGSAISLSLFALAGCASKPTTAADVMKGHATEQQSQVDLKNKLASDWEKGAKLVSSGEKRVKDGKKRVESAERDLKRGQDDIERGSREISEGQSLMQASEKQFRENFPELDIESVK